ncbi:MAG: hypothetical protein HYZ37_18710 [Candidatus Solibacter usitatus]|nr:hypothetical protein [Candidatus Solibacter usitatus]
MTTKSLLLSAISLLAALTSGANLASAQCSGADPRNNMINAAFQSALRRNPTATECNPNRYAGGDFTAGSLPDLVRASLVCSDPWIAQAFLKAGRLINGHAPTQAGPEGPMSTRDGCNYSVYGSWSNFPQLLSKITNTPAVSTPSVASVQAQITGPGQLASGGQATVTWSYSGTPTNCGSGVDLVMTGGPIRANDSYKLARIMNLSARSLTFNMGDWSRSLTSDANVYLSMMDLCSGKIIAPNYQSRITLPRAQSLGNLGISGGGTVKPVWPLSGIDSYGRILDSARNPISLTTGFYFISGVVAQGGGNVVAQGGGNVVAAGGGNYAATLGGVPITLVSTGGSNLSGILVDNRGNPVTVVAQGGGNLQIVAGGQVVAQGGGNVVAQGGGNVVAQGGGNVVAQGGGNLQVMSASTASSVFRLLTSDGAGLLTNNGGTFANPAMLARNLINPAVVGPGGASSPARSVLSVPGQQTAPLAITGFSPVANSIYANKAVLNITWNFTGTPLANQMAIVQMQAGGKSWEVCRAVTVDSKGCRIAPTDWSSFFRTSTPATLSLVDASTRRVLYGPVPITIRIP